MTDARTINSYRNTMSYKFILAAVTAVAASLALAVGAQAAEFGFSSFSVTSSSTQAGAHPDVTTKMTFNTQVDPDGRYDDRTHDPMTPVEPAKDVKVSLPAGLVGDVTGVPRCDAGLFAGSSQPPFTACPDDTQVGVATLDVDLGLSFGRSPISFAVFNLKPSGDAAAEFGFMVLSAPVNLTFKVRATDGGLDTVISNINQAARLFGQSLTLWGVPSDPSHDKWRASCLIANTADYSDPANPLGWQSADDNPLAAPCPVITPRVPLLRNPTSCSDKVVNTVEAVSWVHPERKVTAESDSDALTGCGDVPFKPSISVAPTSTSGDAPTGLDVNVGVEQKRDADGLGAADVKRAVVTLPEGYTISPSAADGLQACDDAHVGLGNGAAADCPAASKVGSATIVSPILDTPLSGPIYLGPSTSPGHYKVYVVVEGQGVRLKLLGDISADPATGRLTTTFDNTPQQPFTAFKLHFDGGDRAVLASPAQCGTSDATATLTPWSSPAGRDVSLTAPVALGGGLCGNNPFAPKLTAGVSNAQAGSSNTAFTLAVARDDRTQALGAISNVVLPAGLTAKVGSVPRCDSARAAAGTCGAESRVGTVSVAAGAGNNPLHLTGTAYLTAGYKGAPYGLSLVVRALAGPYDLGTVVIRSAISVGPDARVSVQTDPLPQILAGIPLRLRSVQLTLDRPGFMVNPTSCGDAAVAATLTGAGGETANAVSRFGLNGCRALPFAPKMTATASKSTKKAGAGLHVALTQGAGQANLKTVAVTLPAGLSIKFKALGTACSQAQLEARACPAASKVGGASAVTSLLDVPLKGAVYLVQGGGSGGSALPKLVALLQGGGLTIPLTGSTSLTKGGRIGTTFNAIPDVPISAFDLDLPHNKRQILETAKSWPACGAAGSVVFTGQNGARVSRTLAVKTKCTSSKKAAKKAPRKK